MTERPKWCLESGCVNSPGNGVCVLKNYVLDGWPRRKTQTQEIERIKGMLAEDKQLIIDYCMRAGQEKGY